MLDFIVYGNFNVILLEKNSSCVEPQPTTNGTGFVISTCFISNWFGKHIGWMKSAQKYTINIHTFAIYLNIMVVIILYIEYLNCTQYLLYKYIQYMFYTMPFIVYSCAILCINNNSCITN